MIRKRALKFHAEVLGSVKNGIAGRGLLIRILVRMVLSPVWRRVVIHKSTPKFIAEKTMGPYALPGLLRRNPDDRVE